MKKITILIIFLCCLCFTKHINAQKQNYTVIGEFQGYYPQDNLENEIVVFRKNKKYGFMDTTGKLLNKNLYNEYKFVSKNLIAVRDNKKWGLLDTKGNVKLECIYDNYKMRDSLISFKKDSIYALLNSKGEFVNTFNFDDIHFYYSYINVV